VNFNRAAHREVMDSLISEGLPANASALETAVVTSSSGKYSSIVKTGMAHVQDEASQLVSHIAAGLGQSILDFCAGNGGKTLALASITRNSKSLHAMDASPERMAVLEARCREYGAKVDIMTPVHKTFDVVLVDAPCSGAGAGRRNPEAKYVAGPIGFPEVQFKILREASKRVAGNGFIIYSVCTFTPEETGDTVEKFLKAGGFRAVHFDELPFRELLEEAAFGAFTNVPGGDIFYVSVMKKET
jgi:16S rRNA (cytosine967-C5)-methyltransferase